MQVYNLTIGLVLFFLTHIFIWLQINGQFVWPWFKDNPLLLSLIGAPISYLLIGFDGLLWPGRLVGFSLGMIVFAVLTSQFLGEGINSKTAISLVLALALVLIQILWK